MKQDSADVDRKFWRIFNRTLGIAMPAGVVAKGDIESWDSLRHVELVFEIEEAFDLNISPNDIVAWYSNTDVILEYLRAHAGGPD